MKNSSSFREEDLQSALDYLSPEDEKYQDWLNVGMALQSAGRPCSEWINWSMHDKRFQPGECEKKWKSFTGHGITVATIFKMAKNRGWKPSSPSSPVMGWTDTLHFDGEDHQKSANAVKVERTPTEELSEYLNALYNPKDIVGYVTESFKGKDGKMKPGGKGVYTRTAGELIESLEKYPEDITDTVGTFDSAAGAWIRINALDGQGIKNDNVLSFKHALVESDKIPPSEQETLYRKLKLPIAALVHSGEKSVHAVVKVDAVSFQEYNERFAFICDSLAKNGVKIDIQDKNPSRMSRMPGVERNGNRQYLIGTNIGCSSWSEWKAFIERDFLSDTDNEFLKLFKPLADFQEEEAKWLIPGWIPADQITIVPAEGGIGKTTFWINLLAGLSSGKPTILDLNDNKTALKEFSRSPMQCAFISTEDSVSKKLKEKLRQAGADLNNIITIDLSEDREGLFQNLKFGSPRLAQFIRAYRPSVCVFDPLQGFIPPEVNMGSRNAMRDCMAPLIGLGEECGTTFIIVCHTNKRKGASGRARVADSADIWDISRSVIMGGYTENRDVRYLSQEKNNYAALQDSILYKVNNLGQIEYIGSSWKHDADFMSKADNDTPKATPCLEECKAFIIDQLEVNGGSMPTRDLEWYAKMQDFKSATIKRSKEALKREKKITSKPDGKAGPWRIYLTNNSNNTEEDDDENPFIELLDPDDSELPF